MLSTLHPVNTCEYSSPHMAVVYSEIIALHCQRPRPLQGSNRFSEVWRGISELFQALVLTMTLRILSENSPCYITPRSPFKKFCRMKKTVRSSSFALRHCIEQTSRPLRLDHWSFVGVEALYYNGDEQKCASSTGATGPWRLGLWCTVHKQRKWKWKLLCLKSEVWFTVQR